MNEVAFHVAKECTVVVCLFCYGHHCKLLSEVMTELHEAASLGDLERLEEALRKGLNPNESDLEWGNRTPLHIAASKGLSNVL